MEHLKKLIQKATEKNCRIQIQYDPNEDGEEWAVKFYPEEDDAHFFAYNTDLDNAARQLLDELRGFNKW